MVLRNLLGYVQTLVFGQVDPLRSRRQQPRIGCDFQVLVRVGEQDDLEARLLDLGTEGLRITLPLSVKKRQEVWISALPGDSLEERQRLRCEVAWSRAEAGGWVAGLRYADTPQKVATAWAQFTLRRLDGQHAERSERRISAGVPVEIHDLDSQCLARGTIRDLSLGGALVLVDTPLPSGETLRVRLRGPGSELGPALYLLATVVGRPASQATTGEAYNLQFFPADRSEQQRLRHLLMTLLQGLRQSGARREPESPKPTPTPKPRPEKRAAPEPLVLPPVLIPGMLSLKGSLAAALASPLPLYEVDLEAEPEWTPASDPPPTHPPMPLLDSERGWLASFERGCSDPVAPSGSPDIQLAALLQSAAEASPEVLVHRILALLALGGTRALRSLLLGARACVGLCRELGINQEVTLQLIHWAALLKDVGELEWLLARQPAPYPRQVALFLKRLKPPPEAHDLRGLRIPGSLFLSRPDLDQNAREQLGLHPTRGHRLLSGFPSLARLGPVVRSHHERWDGWGYPDGLQGKAIPVVARCLAVADVYAALLGQGLTPPQAAERVAQGSGSHFDPSVVEALRKLTGGLG